MKPKSAFRGRRTISLSFGVLFAALCALSAVGSTEVRITTYGNPTGSSAVSTYRQIINADDLFRAIGGLESAAEKLPYLHNRAVRFGIGGLLGRR